MPTLLSRRVKLPSEFRARFAHGHRACISQLQRAMVGVQRVPGSLCPLEPAGDGQHRCSAAGGRAGAGLVLALLVGWTAGDPP